MRTCALFIVTAAVVRYAAQEYHRPYCTLPIIGKTKFAPVELRTPQVKSVEAPFFCVYHFRVQRQAKGNGKREHVIFSRYSRILALRWLHFKAHTLT